MRYRENPCIYSIGCPITGKIKYIGRTNYPYERFQQHLRAMRHISLREKPLYRWMASVVEKGEMPVFKIEKECYDRDLGYFERAYILRYFEEGDLFNVSLTVRQDMGIDRSELLLRIKVAGLTYRQIARSIGVSASVLSSYFNHHHAYLSYQKVISIQKLLQ